MGQVESLIAASPFSSPPPGGMTLKRDFQAYASYVDPDEPTPTQNASHKKRVKREPVVNVILTPEAKVYLDEDYASLAVHATNPKLYTPHTTDPVVLAWLGYLQRYSDRPLPRVIVNQFSKLYLMHKNLPLKCERPPFDCTYMFAEPPATGWVFNYKGKRWRHTTEEWATLTVRVSPESFNVEPLDDCV